MRTEDLAKLLKDAHGRAPHGEKVATIHLFGIRYADELRGHSLQDVAEQAGIGRSFGTEISKGVKLAPYVTLKDR